MTKISKWLAAAALVAVGRTALAQSKVNALAKASQNPIGAVIDVPLDNTFAFGSSDRHTLYGLEVGGLIPIPIDPTVRFIPRISVPFSDVPGAAGNAFRMGDIRLETILAGQSGFGADEVHWGFGPALAIPTATSHELGSGKWSAGISFAEVVMPGRWVVGVHLSQLWSIAGNSSRDETSPFFAQPFIDYNLDHGWALFTAPDIRADWRVDWSDAWSLPLGGGVAKTFSAGRQGATLSVAAYAATVREVGTPTWALHAQLSLLHQR